MKYFIGYLLVFSIVLCKEHKEAKMPFMEYCRYFNYPVESH